MSRRHRHKILKYVYIIYTKTDEPFINDFCSKKMFKRFHKSEKLMNQTKQIKHNRTGLKIQQRKIEKE